MENRGQRHGVIGWATSTLLSAVLVYGLIASPLIVECIPRDGATLVEFLGQDPCHHFVINTKTGNHFPAAFGNGDSDDPCLDIVLDNLGLTYNGIEVQDLVHGGSAQLYGLPSVDEYSLQPQIAEFFRLARQPADPGLLDIRPPVSLRI